MDRLTKRGADGVACSAKPFEISTFDMIDKLAAYEDAEEKGLLVRLPCKIGNTVYTLRENYFDCPNCVHKAHASFHKNIQRFVCDKENWHCPLSIKEHVVEGFYVSQGEAGNVDVSGPGEWGYEGLETFSGFDGKWYRTREDAEARLAELHETEEKENAD